MGGSSKLELTGYAVVEGKALDIEDVLTQRDIAVVCGDIRRKDERLEQLDMIDVSGHLWLLRPAISGP